MTLVMNVQLIAYVEQLNIQNQEPSNSRKPNYGKKYEGFLYSFPGRKSCRKFIKINGINGSQLEPNSASMNGGYLNV